MIVDSIVLIKEGRMHLCVFVDIGTLRQLEGFGDKIITCVNDVTTGGHREASAIEALEGVGNSWITELKVGDD